MPIAPFTVVNLVAGAVRVSISDYLAHTPRPAPGDHHHVVARRSFGPIIREPTLSNSLAVLRNTGCGLDSDLAGFAAAVAAKEEAALVAAARGNLRVLTWNIHRGIGSHGLYDLLPIAHLVAQHDPDIIALQEVNSRGYENTSGAPIKLLAKSLGEHVAAEAHDCGSRRSLWPCTHQPLATAAAEAPRYLRAASRTAMRH